MGRFDRRWVRRTRSGRYAIALDEEGREVLAALAGQLAGLLEQTTDDPSVRRLFPTAYHEDPERDREYQQLVRDELLERRLAALQALRATADATELDEAGLSAWMRAINDLRLVLGTRLDVSEEQDDIDPDDPEAPVHLAYHLLGWILQDVVDALAGDLPPG
jgi:hypothetical protein